MKQSIGAYASVVIAAFVVTDKILPVGILHRITSGK